MASIGLLCGSVVALLVPEFSPPATIHVVRQARTSLVSADVAVFPGVLIAEGEAVLSPTKAKIEAAKAASAAKLAERGVQAPVTKSLEFNIAVDAESKPADVDYFAEANALKAKRLALQESGKALSKSQSAYVAQLRIMEDQARGQARAAKARAEEITAKREAEANEPPSFNKISPIKIPGMGAY